MAYQHHGSAGLVRQCGRYTCEFKLEVLHRLAAENLSCRELSAMYKIANPHSITMCQRQHDRRELRSPQRIPPLNDLVPTKKKTSPRAPEPERLEQADCLLRENQQLRENCVAKKCDAAYQGWAAVQHFERSAKAGGSLADARSRGLAPSETLKKKAA